MVNKGQTKGKKPEERKKILQISQEIALVQKLADNDLRTRDRAVKKLKGWLEEKTKSGAVFVKEDLMLLWRGLFYCMWNSDKPLVQEELCENISNLIHHILNEKDTVLFLEGFFSTMRFEWPHIDGFRLSKYEMLARRVLRQALDRVAQDDWKLVGDFGTVLWTTILKPNKVSPTPIGLTFHLCEIFMQEVAKCSDKFEVTDEVLLDLLKPFVQCIANNMTDSRLRDKIDESVLGFLVEQSDVGIDQQEKIRAWKAMGYPAINLDEIERVEEEEDDEEGDDDDDEEMPEMNDEAESALDPRAGQVHVALPQLSFNPMRVADMIETFYSVQGLNSTAKKFVKKAIKKFQDLEQGKHPIPFEVPVKEDEIKLLNWKPKYEAKRAARDLIAFEEELLNSSKKLTKKEKKKLKTQSFVDTDETEAGETEAEKFVATPKQLAKKKSISPKSEEPPAKRRRRRSSLALIGNWEVTKVDEAAASSISLPTSPSNVGNWDVSCVSEKETAKAGSAAGSDWDKPMQNGEYEYFVAPRKSPKRRSLYKAPSNEELAAENHSPIKDGKENVDRSPQVFMFNPKNSPKPSEESPKTSRKRIGLENAGEKISSPEIIAEVKTVTPFKRARDSLLLTAKTPEQSKSAKTGRNTLLLPALTNSAKKKVSIQLQHNKSQEVHEYVQQLRNSPQTPHDPRKKPVQGLLKGSPVPFKVAIEKFRRNNKLFN